MIEMADHRKIEIKEKQVDEASKLNTSPSKPIRIGSRVDLTTDLDAPNYNELKKTLDDTHARNRDRKPYSLSEVCCSVTTGWHKCLDSTKKSELDKFGVGIVHYFRFIKYFGLFFFLATIMSIPSLFFTTQAGRDANDGEISSNFKELLYMTSLASIARGASQCAKVSLTPPVSPITFSCKRGKIGAFSTVDYGRVVEPLDYLTCDLFNDNSWDKTCNLAESDATALKEAYAGCEGQPNCTLTLNENMFNFAPSECAPWNPSSSEYNSSKSFYFQILCQDIQMELANGKEISKGTVGWVVVSIDAGISLLFFVFLLLLRNFEKKTAANVLGSVDSVDSCTVEVRSLPKMTLSKLRAQLWRHFGQIEVNNQVVKVNVVDVQLAETNTLLRLNSELGTLREKKVTKYRNFYGKWADKKEATSPDVNYDELLKISMAGGKKSQKEFKQIRKMKESQDKIQHKIRKVKNDKKTQVLSAFITFEDKAQRDAVYAYYQRSPFTRCCFAICCCGFSNDPAAFNGSYLSVHDAPDPSSIKWINMDAGNIEKTLRRLVSWIITIALWVASFACMTYVRNEQADIAQQVRPNKDCSGYENVNDEQVREDNAKGADGLGLLECYCRQDVSRTFEAICSDWTWNRLLSESLPYLIVVIVIIINFLMQFVFYFLSAFERHRSITTESISRIIKIFVAQALNTGIIILIVNARFSSTNPAPSLLDGIFDDVTPQWYLDVATTLLLTMIINIISLPATNLATYILGACTKCCDRKCTCDEKKTRKKSQKAWVALYTGPEFMIELRYARILTVIFVCLFYSAYVPLLYVTAFATIFVIYWMDKFYLLKVCQIPRTLDRKLHTMVRHTLVLAVLLHLGNAVWAYGQTEVFGDSDSFQEAADILRSLTNDQAPGVFARLLQRAIQYQNLSITILFLAILILALFRIFFNSTLMKLIECCSRRKTQKRKSTTYSDKVKYFGRIKYDDLDLERKYLEKEIMVTEDDALKSRLEDRLERVKAEMVLRANTAETSDDKFIGIFSYSLSHHPTYKRFFGAKGLIEATSP